MTEKNQSEDFKKRRIFPRFSSINCPEFYGDPETLEIKKILMVLQRKLNILELSMPTQAGFWFILFNFMTSINSTIEHALIILLQKPGRMMNVSNN